MVRFISMRVFVSQVGDALSKWRVRFLTWVSDIWLLIFFVPGFLLGKLSLFGEDRLFQGFLVWLGILIVFSPICMLANWLAAKVLFEMGVKKCSTCGTSTHTPDPALRMCQRCGSSLGKWWFVEINRIHIQ